MRRHRVRLGLGAAGGAVMIFHEIVNDSALFPPGNAPTDVAVPAHDRHRRAARGRYIGAFMVPARRVTEIARLWSAIANLTPLNIGLTFNEGPDTLADTLTNAQRLDQVRVVGVEVAIPADREVAAAVASVAAAASDSVRACVEVPRDARRPDVIAALADAGLSAKFRTGGTSADYYPGEHELAAAIHRSVAYGVAFKATAGLHRAVRNTDPVNGFEQHGFLNIIAAVGAAADGADAADLAALLGSRDEAALTASVAHLTHERAKEIRRWFLGFSSCSISEPLEDLMRLGLLPCGLLDQQPHEVHG